jgi:hypothetical protein
LLQKQYLPLQNTTAVDSRIVIVAVTMIMMVMITLFSQISSLQVFCCFGGIDFILCDLVYFADFNAVRSAVMTFFYVSITVAYGICLYYFFLGYFV